MVLLCVVANTQTVLQNMLCQVPHLWVTLSWVTLRIVRYGFRLWYGREPMSLQRFWTYSLPVEDTRAKKSEKWELDSETKDIVSLGCTTYFAKLLTSAWDVYLHYLKSISFVWRSFKLCLDFEMLLSCTQLVSVATASSQGAGWSSDIQCSIGCSAADACFCCFFYVITEDSSFTCSNTWQGAAYLWLK